VAERRAASIVNEPTYAQPNGLPIKVVHYDTTVTNVTRV
jgi:hypothetical protein